MALKVNSVDKAYISTKLLFFLPPLTVFLTQRCVLLKDPFSGALRTVWHPAQIFVFFPLFSISKFYILLFFTYQIEDIEGEHAEVKGTTHCH